MWNASDISLDYATVLEGNIEMVLVVIKLLMHNIPEEHALGMDKYPEKLYKQ